MIHRVATFDKTVCGLDVTDELEEEGVVIADEELKIVNRSKIPERLNSCDKNSCFMCWEDTYTIIRSYV